MAYDQNVDRRRPIAADLGMAAAVALMALLATGCDDVEADDANDAIERPGSDAGGPDGPAQAQSQPVQTPGTAAAAKGGDASPAGEDVETPTPTEAFSRAAPEAATERRQAGRAMMIYSKPDFTAGFRGKIPRGEIFDVVEHVEGSSDCGRDGWARLRVDAYACLERTRVSKKLPRALPVLSAGRLMPFHYARRRKTGDAPPRWKSSSALARGDDPTDFLELDHDYAFVQRKRRKGGNVLTDRAFGAVREADVRRLAPSEFHGRDLALSPIDEGKSLAWIVAWPHAEGFAAPGDTEKREAKFEFQSQLYVDPQPVEQRRATYFRVDDDTTPARWIDAKQLRILLPAAPPEGVAPAEVWLDVELTQQTLTIMRGADAEFTTLVSSGSHKHPTPVGLYRITSKHGFGDMRSRAGEDEPYHVEAVPWIMYFKGRYALHGAFWHNRFGSRMSHGCINLSAADAARVFNATHPQTPGGWISVYESPGDEGTLLRIRKGDEIPPDNRKTATTDVQDSASDE